MKNDKAYVVAISREPDDNDTMPNPWMYLCGDGSYGNTDENEKRAKRYSLGEARKWVETLEVVTGYRATYFVASEFK